MWLAIGIILIIILAFILWKMIKPYTLKYDGILFLTGQIGSGKTLTAVKKGTQALKKARLTWWIQNVFQLKIINYFRKCKNNKIIRQNAKSKTKKPLLEYLKPTPKPQIYCNFPLLFKPHWWTRTRKLTYDEKGNCIKDQKDNREWACKLRKKHLYLTKEIAQNSVVIIDELPQFVNQFNWDKKPVQTYVNEFITFFRHYYAGTLILTAQSSNDVVAQIRRKGNKATWCMNFRRHLFGLFYSIDMCDMVLNDDMLSISTSILEENTKKYYSFFPPKDTYDSRWAKKRVKNILEPLVKKQDRWNKLTSNYIMRVQEYNSPLDDNTTKQQKQSVDKLAEEKETKNE